MNRNHLLTLAAATLAGLALPAAIAPPASAAPSQWEYFEFSYGPQANEDFCDVTGLAAIQQGTTTGRARIVVKGPDELPYEYDWERYVDTWTNPANGRIVTVVGAFQGGVHTIVDNGDGTTTLVIKNTGTNDYYDMAGNKIGHDAGQAVFSLLFGNAGTPDDLSDDSFLAFLGFDKSTGTPNAFCPSIVAGISWAPPGRTGVSHPAGLGALRTRPLASMSSCTR
jgi:hypothetical protein